MTTTFQTNITDTTYNGWTNYETWNVALWIGNDEGLCNIARECGSYKEFCNYVSFEDGATLDGVKWNDPAVNVVEIDEMIEEFNQ